MKLRNSGLVIRETMRWLVQNPMHSWEVLKNMLIKYVSNTYYIPENLVKYTIVLFLISFLYVSLPHSIKILIQSSSLSEYQDISRKQISEKKRAFKWSLSIFGLLLSQLSIKDNSCACVKDRHDQLLPVVILALVLKIDMTSFYLFSRILMGQWGHQHARTMLPAHHGPERQIL